MSAHVPFHLEGEGPLTPDQFAQVVDLSTDAVLFLDLQDRIRAWNQGAVEMFGYQRSEALGQAFDLLVPEDLRRDGELDRIRDATERDGVLRNHATRRRHKDGQQIHVALNRTAIRNEDGQVVGHAVFLRDMTDAELLKRKSERSQQMARIGELASQIAHEVRNPLAGIHGALQILRRRLQPGPEEAAVFDDVAAEIGRLDQLVTDLMRFGRPASSRLTRVDFADWLEGWRQRMVRECEQRGAALEIEAVRDLWVEIDPVLFDQTLRNLFENAIEASEDRVQINLRLTQVEERARLLFEDDGPGIPEAVRARILDPFFTTKSRGSGLGLPICQRHVESLGGSLRVLAADLGTTVEISLPRVPAPQ